jgi:hypothetical protein
MAKIFFIRVFLHMRPQLRRSKSYNSFRFRPSFFPLKPANDPTPTKTGLEVY